MEMGGFFHAVLKLWGLSIVGGVTLILLSCVEKIL